MSQSIVLIAGLGNPGPEYSATRHNAGAWLVAAIANHFRISLRDEPRHKALTARFETQGHEFKLAIPQTFMNLSGQSLISISQFYKIPPEQILIAHDELDLPAGTVRLKQGGGHGGHNGLRDIIGRLGTNVFYRFRIGIGHPGHSSLVTNYVLSKPAQDEQDAIQLAIERCMGILPMLALGDVGKAMNSLHATKTT